MKGSDNQEKLVYQIIEDAGNKGKYMKKEAEKTCLLSSDIGTEILAFQGVEKFVEYTAICVKRRGKCNTHI